MNRSIAAFIVITGAAGLVAAGDTRTIEAQAQLAAGQEVRLDFPVGELEIVGVEGARLRIEVEGRCKHGSSRCEEHLEEIEIEIRESGGAFRIEVAPHSKWRWWDSLQIEARMTYPSSHELIVDMGVGELDIEGLTGDLEVDLGVGEVSVDLPVEAVRSVSIDAGIGETELKVPDGWVRGERSFLIGSESSWRDGTGQARVRVEVGVGEAVVRLQD